MSLLAKLLPSMVILCATALIPARRKRLPLPSHLPPVKAFASPLIAAAAGANGCGACTPKPDRFLPIRAVTSPSSEMSALPRFARTRGMMSA